MRKTDKARQQAYRRRMQEQGYKQYAFWLYAFWLSDKGQEALKLLVPPDGNLSSVVDAAIQHYHTYQLSKTVSSNVTSNKHAVSSNITSNVSSNPKPVSSNRYMSQDLEDCILELRQSGMRLNEVAQRLSSEGYRNAKGEPCGTGTLSKAETRAKTRQGKV